MLGSGSCQSKQSKPILNRIFFAPFFVRYRSGFLEVRIGIRFYLGRSDPFFFFSLIGSGSGQPQTLIRLTCSAISRFCPTYWSNIIFLKVFVMTKAVSNKNICLIKAVLLSLEHMHFSLIFASHGSISPPPFQNNYITNGASLSSLLQLFARIYNILLINGFVESLRLHQKNKYN